ncbi:MAG: CpaF/VirB11 family protein [Clostridiales Family XIII bacterium]|nr:CpaF/VirB11 family protein [Clostridiales Family XIII bacterium]
MNDYKLFHELCTRVSTLIENELELVSEIGVDSEVLSFVELQKKAIMGYTHEANYLKSKINEVLNRESISSSVTMAYPPWYENQASAIFEEVWGMCSLAEWFGDRYATSSSAKVIGDRIYFMQDGAMQLMPQKIDVMRREQLVRNLLLLSTTERLDKDYHEIYLLDGTRVTIFRRDMVKDLQETIIFRRYIVPNYTFEEQARRNTIPNAAIPLFETMVKLGYNVAFCGAVKTSKTTFLSTWQRYEDEALEGVMVETDPEIPLQDIMPTAPIVQLLADGESLQSITKNLLRSDADYFIFAEARDAVALDTAIRLARKGTRRMKMTFHMSDPTMFARDVAIEIAHYTGQDLLETQKIVASSFDYIFHFIQLKDKGVKKLSAIYEIGVDDAQPYTRPILTYDVISDVWHFHHNISEEKRIYGYTQSPEDFHEYDELLKDLSDEDDVN